MSTAGQSRTPNEVLIEPRDITFDLAQYLSVNWNGGDAFQTDFSNALSISFPRGEKFFVDSVREFLPNLTDPKLKEDAEKFVRQEYLHRREHERFNNMLCEARGYDKEDIESIYIQRIAKSDQLPALLKLSITVCLEHFTALFAHGVLTDKRWLENVHPELANFWKWHALEETEHKSVAYDVFLAVGGDRKMLRRIMRIVLPRFFLNTFRTMRKMQKADKRSLSPISYWFRGIKYLFGKGGILKIQGKHYTAFFNDDFHPWQHNNSDVLNETLEQLNSALITNQRVAV